ncbi:response regulator [Planotetraspora silvatica]|uniref:Response regulator n=1 Tax=Planotetraspora silvatica TaxID=234614 RepID=A0A8J3UQN0_9ACTN|nr:response regulator [Planotetraspora silvatica]GII49487.1 response regulator [Planotetraspora silvatica]
MGLRCLIVDDNDHFLEVACDVLGREGIEIVGVASTRADAISQAATLRPDVLLVDITLGDESGLDLARDLASGEHAEPSRVILISTYAEGDLADIITASPAIAFLPKARLSGRAISEIVRAAEHPPDLASPDRASPNGHSSWRARGKRHPGPY